MGNIPKDASKKNNNIYLLPKDLKIHGLEEKKDSEMTSCVNLKYYNHSHECFSCWTKEELVKFSEFTSILTQQTWAEIYRSGGKSKVGLGYTVHKNKDVLPNKGKVPKISEDITLFELRTGDKARVHGFRSKSVFFLVWLDRNHQIYPM